MCTTEAPISLSLSEVQTQVRIALVIEPDVLEGQGISTSHIIAVLDGRERPNAELLHALQIEDSGGPGGYTWRQL